MRFEVTIPYVLKETDSSVPINYDESYVVERWVSRKLKATEGKLVEFSANKNESVLLVEFENLDQAKEFNQDLHNFFSPKMYLDTEEDDEVTRFSYLDPHSSV